MKGIGIPYAFCYLIPEKALYRKNVNSEARTGNFTKFDVLTQADVKVYFDIANDPAYKNRTPDAMFIGIYKLFSDEYLRNLHVGDEIDTSSQQYLDGIKPKWSDIECVKDESIRNYYFKQFNLGHFLDNFIKQMGIDVNE